MTTQDAVIVALLTSLVISTVLIGRSRDLFASVMLFGMFSLLLATLFVALAAPDVAFTEAAVGGGISTILFLLTVSITNSVRSYRARRLYLAFPLCAAVGALLVYASMDMPAFGDPQAPANLHVARYYLSHTMTDIGVPNVVTAVLASYRGVDTLGELAVIFTAGMGAVALLRRGGMRP